MLLLPHPTPPEVRVAVLDDHPAVRAGVRAILEPAADLRFVGGAASEEDLWPLLRREQPTVLVLDRHHPGRDGLALCIEIKLRPAAPAVVLYAASLDAAAGVAAVIAGADVMLSKTSPAAALPDAVRGAAHGTVHPQPCSPRVRAGAAARLDPSEHAIFAMRLAGHSPAKIASTLNQPVSVIVGRIMRIAELLGSSEPATDSEPSTDSDQALTSIARAGETRPVRRRHVRA